MELSAGAQFGAGGSGLVAFGAQLVGRLLAQQLERGGVLAVGGLQRVAGEGQGGSARPAKRDGTRCQESRRA